MAEAAKEAPRQIGERIGELDAELRDVDEALQNYMLWVHLNLPHESVPYGPDDSHNINGDPHGRRRSRSLGFEPQAHWGSRPGTGHHRF